MTPYIIAEAAQGYEGSVQTALLLVRGAAAAKADAIKFQIILADDLAQPGYEYYPLFQSLEMPEQQWRSIREAAKAAKLAFVADIFGPGSMAIAEAIGVDAVKLHSTCFFDRPLIRRAFALGCPVYGSVGGILPDEVSAMLAELSAEEKARFKLLFGFQAEPTPIERNNLARIASLRGLTGLDIGFMDHSDGDGPDQLGLSILALGMGVRIFEKHITLDRALQMEDYVSALAPADFANYVATLHRLVGAIGSADLTLTEIELGYRGRALKRVIAAHDLPAGKVVSDADIRLVRPAVQQGCFDPALVLGRSLRQAVAGGTPIRPEDIA